jgi:hypothetical protein
MKIVGDAESAGRNLEVFLRRIIQQSWLQTSTLPFVLQGFRVALKDAPDIVNPMQTVFGEVYGALVERVGHVTAASYLMGLFSLAGPEDKAVASRVVLLHR